MLTGAEALLRTLVDAGVTTCFTNPGTSEIHFVAALDSVPEMRAVLTLFEGVATGAADGYARMADVPAATLLHLGPGLGNGLANLHNARRAKSPGAQHRRRSRDLPHAIRPPAAVRHRDDRTERVDLGADVGTNRRPRPATRSRRSAAATGPPGQVATLIVPADVSWQRGRSTRCHRLSRRHRPRRPARSIEAVAKATPRRPPSGILLGGRALRERGLVAAAKIAAATGTRLFAESFPASRWNAAPACPRWIGLRTGQSSSRPSSMGSSI